MQDRSPDGYRGAMTTRARRNRADALHAAPAVNGAATTDPSVEDLQAEFATLGPVTYADPDWVRKAGAQEAARWASLLDRLGA